MHSEFKVYGVFHIFGISICNTAAKFTSPNGEVSVQNEVIQKPVRIDIYLGWLKTDYIKWELDNSKNTQIRLWEG